MMATIRAYNYYDDESHDNCGSATIAVLEVGRIKIPLCDECYRELSQSVQEFDATTFCHACEHFELSRSGWSYGGKCKKTGYDAACMETCPDAVQKGG